MIASPTDPLQWGALTLGAALLVYFVLVCGLIAVGGLLEEYQRWRSEDRR